MHILLVDDDEDVRGLTRDMLDSIGKHAITEAPDGATGCRFYLEGRQFINGGGGFDLIISDFQMPRKNGAEFLHWIRRRDKKTPFLMVTADPDMARKHLILNDTDPFAIIEKPFGMGDLQHAMKELGCNMDDEPESKSDEALNLIKRAHGALDTLFAELIVVSRKPQTFHFMPSESTEWPVLVDLAKFLKKHGLRKENEDESERVRREVQDSATG